LPVLQRVCEVAANRAIIAAPVALFEGRAHRFSNVLTQASCLYLASTNGQVTNSSHRAKFMFGFMRYDVAVGETGARSGIPHRSAHRRSSPPISNHIHVLNGGPCPIRLSNLGIDTLPSSVHQSREALPITNHQLALRAAEGSLITNH